MNPDAPPDPQDRPGRMRPRGLSRAWRLVLRSAAALGLLALVLWFVGPAQMAAQLRAASVPWFLAALACAIAANLLSAWRWGAIARTLGLRTRFAALVSAYAQGIAVNTVLPGATLGGDALRALRLARLGNDGLLSGVSVFLDRASGLWVLCGVSLVAAIALLAAAPAPAGAGGGGGSPLSLPLIALLAAALLAVLSAPFLIGPGRSDSGGSPRLARLRQLRALLHARRAALLRSVLPSIGVQVLSAGTLWLCARAAGAEVGLLAVLAVAAPVFLAAAVPVSVGGFGPREAAAALVFPWVGVAPEAGVAAAVLYGVAAAVQGALGAPLLAFAPVDARAVGASADATRGHRPE
jgi:uncharacterized membrane protein YbhN (UPF0104 family)